LYRFSRNITVLDVADKFGTGCSEGSVINHTNELIDRLLKKKDCII
jgi:hypothetical protein